MPSKKKKKKKKTTNPAATTQTAGSNSQTIVGLKQSSSSETNPSYSEDTHSDSNVSKINAPLRGSASADPDIEPSPLADNLTDAHGCSPSTTPDTEPQNTAATASTDNGANVRREADPFGIDTNTSTTVAPESTSNDRKVETSDAMFQAVGIIVGEVNFTEDNKATIAIANKQYPLFYTRPHYLAYTGLKKEIEATNNNTQRLIVYPRITHFPSRDKQAFISFQLVGFDKGKDPKGISEYLKDNEFKLCGLWQFIPVSRIPCVSIFRNFNKERLEYIKQAEPATKAKFMKASHIPLLWRDAPVRPFRFDPKAGKDQGQPSFVSVKAKFIPSRDAWGFVETIAEHREKAPRFLKVSKKDKAAAQKGTSPKKEFKEKKPIKKPVKKIN
ncbi:MAG: hypothetical protein QNJ54_06415 [Prochloraceae cyanobacterium]|nr:hypothetical protein [Prochloraceae cyanobacterium]